MFNLSFLKTFVSLAKTHSFRRAAQLNSITQSAVSQQIRALEKTLKTPLIERSGKSIRLTESGKVFYKYAENILKQVDEAFLHTKKQTHTHNGAIRIATIYSIGLYRLQPLIKKYLKKYPEVSIHLEYHHNNVVYEKILNRSVDFGFVAFPKSTEGLSAKMFAEEKLALIQSSERPVIKKTRASLEDLNNCKYVSLCQKTPTGKELNKIFHKAGILLDTLQEFENVETLKSAVHVGMGCAVVPENILSHDLKKNLLQTVNIKDLTLSRPLGILSPNGMVMTKAKQKFYEMFVN